jgi:hypothetical protein
MEGATLCSLDSSYLTKQQITANDSGLMATKSPVPTGKYGCAAVGKKEIPMNT